MKSYPLIANFDGAKFAARYGLNALHGDFSVSNGMLRVPDNLPDDPPIQEIADPIIPAPPGIHVHTMRKAESKQGNKFIIDQAESNCIHVVLDNESQLNDPWLISIPMDAGSAAYCKNTEKTWLWNGTMWKKP